LTSRNKFVGPVNGNINTCGETKLAFVTIYRYLFTYYFYNTFLYDAWENDTLYGPLFKACRPYFSDPWPRQTSDVD